ncbi:MAG TPA: glycosyltransferase family 1 protein [Candidatus Eisenbacteria bacterium]|nr:glycosyltransferase family 1 protein [Candidatus Eisenbacteria bacterium]
MKVAIDVSPLSSGHAIRGVGFYVKNLLNSLKKYHPENDYFEFINQKTIPRDVDIIHYPYFDPFSLTLPLNEKRKTVVTVHDVTPLLFPNLFPIGPKGKFIWFLQKRSLRKIGNIITDSKSSKKDIETLLHIKPERIDSIYLAADEHFYKMQDTEYKTQVKNKYKLPDSFVLYVGDATPNKNLPTLVKAVLRTTIPLVMVGKSLVDESVDVSNKWAKDIKEVRALQKANSQQIRFLGFVDDEDLIALYNLASVFVMPSLYEGFGLPILEAMQSGCPVITSSKGSLREVAGDSAYIVDSYDVSAMAQAIQKVIGDRQLAKKLSQKGLLQAKKFSWEKTANQTVDVYKKVTQNER